MTREIDRLAYEYMLLTRHTSSLGRKGRDGGLERSAYILLSRIDAQGPMTVNELSEAFLLDTSTIHRQMTALLRNGLVERFPDPDGKLVRRFRITDTGMKALTAQRSYAENTLADLVADWPDEDVQTFLDYLQRFNMAIEQRQDQPWPRP